MSGPGSAPPPGSPQVAVVGGGLAGMAAAWALARHGLHVELFEAQRQLGGRASSFRQRETGQLVDYCQHVSMGCCTQLDHFCRATGIADGFVRHRAVHFCPPHGQPVTVRACRYLPAPLHLVPAVLGLAYLSLRDRLGIIRAVARLARTRSDDDPRGPSAGQWLAAHGQSARALAGFWEVVLVSALGESLDRVSLAAARKVLVDGFLAARDGYELLVPRRPLAQLFGEPLARALTRLGVRIHLGAAVRRLEGSAARVTGLRSAAGRPQRADYVVLAVPWRRLPGLLPAGVGLADLPESSPITAVHLWFDRPITEFACAALVGRMSQWVFDSGGPTGESGQASGGHYYQVVISASRGLLAQTRAEILAQVADELRQTWPAARSARLLRGTVVKQRHAVFSPRPGLERIRPPQRTRVPGLVLAGDWTATGWPSTMEGAVRSGYLAAEAVLADVGMPTTVGVPNPRRGLLARLLLGRDLVPACVYSGSNHRGAI